MGKKLYSCVSKTSEVAERNGKNPQLSVVIPVYNAAKSVRACVESVLGQNVDSYEIILVDDGSTDGSLDLMFEMAETVGQIIIYSGQNQGRSAARNAGIEAARGEWILFLDADDALEVNSLASALEVAAREDCDAIWCNYRSPIRNITVTKSESEARATSVLLCVLNPTKRKNLESFLTRPDSKLARAVWAKLYRREILEETSISFSPSLDVGEDNDFNVRFLLHANKVAFLDQVLYCYNEENEGTIRTLKRKDVTSVLLLADHMLDSYTPLIDKDGLSLVDLQANVAEDVTFLIRRAARYSDNYRVAAEWLEPLSSNARIMQAIHSAPSAGRLGKIRNLIQRICLKRRNVFLIIVLESFLIKVTR